MFCISAVRTKRLEAAGPPKKKRKKTQKKSQEQGQKATEHKTKPVGQTAPTSSRAKKPTVSKQEKNSSAPESPEGEGLQSIRGQSWDGTWRQMSPLLKGTNRFMVMIRDFSVRETIGAE